LTLLERTLIGLKGYGLVFGQNIRKSRGRPLIISLKAACYGLSQLSKIMRSKVSAMRFLKILMVLPAGKYAPGAKAQAIINEFSATHYAVPLAGGTKFFTEAQLVAQHKELGLQWSSKTDEKGKIKEYVLTVP